ncbi:regulator of replication initiation timing [Pedobacter sp. UYEF25]
MSSVAIQLESILDKTTRLVELCAALQEENDLLKLENQSLNVALSASKDKSKDLDEKMRVLKLAKSIEGNNEKSLDIKLKINDFVREIDRSIALLKK